MLLPALHLRRLGLRDYEPVWRAMQAFTSNRDATTPDAIWLTEHPPIFTLGRAATEKDLLEPGLVPVVRVDRGGQITYHGPGQLVLYLLLDLRRRRLGVRQLVTAMEQALIGLLDRHDIRAQSRPDAPGVYVDDGKVASIGLRIRRGCSFHGLSLNIEMDLEPFSHINPCGHPDLQVTQLSDLWGSTEMAPLSEELVMLLAKRLGYNQIVDPSQELVDSTFPEL